MRKTHNVKRKTTIYTSIIGTVILLVLLLLTVTTAITLCTIYGVTDYEKTRIVFIGGLFVTIAVCEMVSTVKSSWPIVNTATTSGIIIVLALVFIAINDSAKAKDIWYCIITCIAATITSYFVSYLLQRKQSRKYGHR